MKIQFSASIAPLQSAILIDGIDGNARVKIDIPGNEKEAIAELASFSQKPLKITMEVSDDDKENWSKDFTSR